MPLPLVKECLPLLEGGRVLLGLSGGRDSVALLHVLAERGVDLCACHVNHGIRGAEADADAAFCAELYAGGGIYKEMFDKQAEFYRDNQAVSEGA